MDSGLNINFGRHVPKYQRIQTTHSPKTECQTPHIAKACAYAAGTMGFIGMFAGQEVTESPVFGVILATAVFAGLGYTTGMSIYHTAMAIDRGVKEATGKVETLIVKHQIETMEPNNGPSLPSPSRGGRRHSV